jgi:hypothetical protein
VTHNQQIARDAKRTVVMRDGAIVCDTTDFRLAAHALREDLDEELPDSSGHATSLHG